MLDLAKSLVNNSDAQYSEVRIENTEGLGIMVKNGILEASSSSASQGAAIRVLVDGALGIGFTNDLSKDGLEKAMKIAVKIAKASRKILKEPIEFAGSSTEKVNYNVKQKKPILDTSPEDKIKQIMEIDNQLEKSGLKIPSRFFDYTDYEKRKVFVNSEGAEIESRIPYINLFYLTTVMSGDEKTQRMNQYGGTGGWELAESWQLEKKILEEAHTMKKIMDLAKTAEKGPLTVILSPELVGIASHESVGHPYEADRIWGREAAQAGGSFVTKEMLGTRIGSDIVTVVDDPTIENSYGFYKYDDEGVKARRRYLIKDGMINELLQNRWSGNIFGTESNGAARASAWNREPIVRMANTFVLPGDHSFEELVEGVKKGVYIKSYMEWNIDDKRFNQRYVGLEAYEIINGELGGFVKTPSLEITTPTFWSSIDAVGKDLDFSPGTCGKGDPMQGIPVFFGGPHVRLQNIKLGN